MNSFATVRTDSLIRYLDRHLEGEVRFDSTTRNLYATDASLYQIPPLGVVIPKTVDDLVATVQIAAELRVPITARGGGTSLSGQAIGPGIVLDCSKYLNRVVDLDPAGCTVRVQPGIVLDQLNRAVASHGLIFGPDVAPANRATIGGMIGNNSAGARSVVHGRTVDHVRSLQMILADGSRAGFGSLSEREYANRLELRTKEGDAYRTTARILREHAAEIDERFPKILRAVSGYNLPGTQAGRSLVPLLTGSEGTLGVIAEAELALVPRPRFRGLLVPHFASLRSALDAVGVCLEFGPSAVELLDKLLIDLARNQRSLQRHMAAVVGSPDALLMAEISGDSEAEVVDRIEKLRRRLDGIAGMTACVTATDPERRDPLWTLRSASMPLLYSIPGDRKPVTFVEDCAVSPERMPEFATRFRELLQKHGTDGAFYGHASVGCLHIRPLLNLHDLADVRTMRTIMEEVTDLVLNFHGSLSGEHGDGLVRSEWNQKMFGPVLYEAFRQIKRAFDPENILNPGKVVDAPAMDVSLRVPPGNPVPNPPTVFDYTQQGGFFRSIELCNGAGVCRKTQGGAMCPSYRATRDEHDTTRGRANSLRIALQSSSAPNAMAQRWVADVMDLCLSCKACKSECPSNVDMAKLKAEFQQAYYAQVPRPRGHYLLKNIDTLSPLASRWATVANWFSRRGFVRGLMEAVTGIDRRRSLPEFHRINFRRWFAQHPQPVGDRPGVILMDDCFTTYQEPQIGIAAVQVLEAAGFRVELAGICCGRAMVSKGFLTETRELARKTLPGLAQRVQAGLPILGLEPSCIYTLADEWPELVPGSDARAVAEAAIPVETWLTQNGRLDGLCGSSPDSALLHTHCHQSALAGSSGPAAAVRCVPGVDLTTLDAGCCGMAGSFGYEKEHYDISTKIAEQALLPAIRSAPDSVVLATGTSCRHQIRDLAGRVALHPVEYLARHLSRAENGTSD